MKRLAFLIVAGCNEIFGLGPTIPYDAPSDAMAIRTNLVWGAVTTDGMGAIDPVLEYGGIGSETERPGVPKIFVGDEASLSEVTYSAGDGSFEIPYRLRDAPHRIVYTLPGESVPHEVQWSVAGAYLVVPRTTRLGAPTVPAGSGYNIHPQGLAGNPTVAALATSGAFTFTITQSDFDLASGPFVYAFAAKAKTLAGPLGAPQTSHGDWVLVMDWGARTPTTQTSTTGFAIASVDLVGGSLSVPPTQPTWIKTPTRTLSNLTCPADCAPSYNSLGTQMRITGVLGSLVGTLTSQIMYGISPSLELPGFVPGGAPDFVDRPLMIPFLISTTQDSTLTLVDPSTMLPFERVIYSGITGTRSADGVTLSCALQVVMPAPASPSVVAYPAPFAQTVKLDGVDLSGASDDVSLPGSSAMHRLTWDAEAGYSANDFVVTLYEIAAGTLSPVRIYHVLAPSVSIDGSLLAPGHTYVFGITSRHGLPAADRGDYHKAAYPFGVATTFPRTFVVQ